MISITLTHTQSMLQFLGLRFFLISRLLLMLSLDVVMLQVQTAKAQAQDIHLVHIVDPLKSPINDRKFEGVIAISPTAAMTCGGLAYLRDTLAIKIDAATTLDVSLIPNTVCTPANSLYRVIFTPKTGTPWPEYWLIPLTSDTLSIQDVRASVPAVPSQLPGGSPGSGVGSPTLIDPSQITRAGATIGQAMCWLSTAQWGPGSCGGDGGGGGGGGGGPVIVLPNDATLYYNGTGNWTVPPTSSAPPGDVPDGTDHVGEVLGVRLDGTPDWRVLEGYLDNGQKLVLDGTAIGELSGNNTWVGHQFYPASSTQSITSASDTIACNRHTVAITASTSITLTSLPMIADGQDGQVCVIQNVGSQALVLRDESTTVGTNVQLNASTYTLGSKKSITLQFSQSIGDWVQR